MSRIAALAGPLLAATAGAAEQQGGGESARFDPARIALLIEHKCAECHVPDSSNAKARRHFDSARDLPRLVEDYVAPGDLLLSELWSQIESGEMPPQEAANGGLNAEEREQIRAWILQGAPLPAQAGEAAAAAPLPRAGAPPAVSRPALARRLLALGRLHPSATHFPIAFLLGAGLLELLLLRRPDAGLSYAARVLVRLAALTAPLAAALGWLNAADSQSASRTLEWHRWLGLSTALLSALLLLASELAAREGASRRAYRCLLAAGCVLVVWSAHLGGVLVFGADYLPF